MEFFQMSSVEDFPARTSALQEIKRELVKKQGRASGQSVPVYLGKFDQNTPSLKTSQHCLTDKGEIGLSEFSGTFPRSGMMRSGTAYQLPSLARTITEIGSGLYATPRSCSAMAATLTEKTALSKFPNLETQIARQMFPTPCDRDWKDVGTLEKMTEQHNKRDSPSLALVAKIESQQISGQLNPAWIEWLMGFPTGHTDLNALETQ